jgi:S-adenosylmethionine hydrolase
MPDMAQPLPAHVVRISEEYANINTDVSEKTLSAYGISQQTEFSVTFKGEKFRALLGEDYSDVERGDWIALIEDDGNLQLAISFGNAATEISCTVGDTLYIERLGTAE